MELEYDIEFFAAGDSEPPDIYGAIEVLPLPRPDFPVVLRCHNDGSGRSRGSGVHPIKKRDVVQLTVEVTNNTDSDLTDLYAELRTVELGPGLRVKNPRAKFEPVALGATSSCSLTLQATAKATPETSKFELLVHTRSGRTLSLLPFEIDVAE